MQIQCIYENLFQKTVTFYSTLSPKLSTHAEERKLKTMVKKKTPCNENLLRPEPFRTADLEHTITFCAKHERRNILLLLHKKKKSNL